jgi:ATP-dependent Clp endopeptidase proteolytic subunit ClpP
MPNEIYIYSAIGEDYTAKMFIEELNAFNENDDVTVRINSPGGSVFEGLAIYNALLAHKGNVTVMIDGIALSMASGIAMAGNEVVMAENALMMIHNPSSGAFGEVSDLERAIKMLHSAKDALVIGYATKSGLDNERVENIMSEETWLTAKEAVALGLADSIGGELSVAANYELPTNLKVPTEFVEPLSKVVTSKPCSELTEKDPMSNDNPTTPINEGPVAATLTELLALNGADNDFAVEQLQNGATLVDAQNALNAKLIAQLDEAKAATADANARADEAKAAVVEAPVNEAPGQDALPSDGADSDLPSNDLVDPMATLNSEINKHREAGLNPVDAYVKAHKSNPGLIEAIRNQVN